MKTIVAAVEVRPTDKGYTRMNHPRLGKLYAGEVYGGFPRQRRGLRWFFKRAQDARDYAVKVAARWNHIQLFKKSTEV